MSDQTPAQTPDQSAQAPLFTIGDRAYDVEAAQKKILNADNHISTIEQDNQSLKQQLAEAQAKLDQATKLDDALSKLQGNTMQPQQQTTENQPHVDVEALRTALLKEAQEAATNSVSSFRQQEIAESNSKESIGAAQRMFGSDYETKLREKGASLGLDDTSIVKMAESNPALFKQTFGLTGTPKVHVNPDGSVNTSGLPNVEKPTIKRLGKQWGSSAKLEALEHNTSELNKVIASFNGDVNAAARYLGIDIRNLAN